MTLDEFAEEYADLTRDVLSAGYQTYDQRLRDWFQLLDTSPYSQARVRELETSFDFEPWYKAGESTVGSMVGSGRLDWAQDRTARMAQELALFRHFTFGEQEWSDFSSNFLWSGSRYEDMIAEINSQIFEPFTRRLLKEFLRAANASAEEIPAADRLVTLDHNSSAYQSAVTSLDEVTKATVGSNELGSNVPTEKERVVAELEAGRHLLKARQIRVQAALQLLLPALRWIGDHAGGTIVGALVTAAIAALAAVFGINLPSL